jgi:small subunit ribosomal protein S1
MSTELQRHDIASPPPTLDEGYWESLLSEGEHPSAVLLDSHDEYHDESYQHDDHYTGSDHTTADCDWEEMERITQRDEAIDLKVVGYNRGGLLVEWQTLRGFVPASQLINFPATSNSAVRRNALLDRVGHALHLRVIELNPEKNRLILSERAAQAEPGERHHILNSLKAGDVIYGRVTNLCDFGAFIDLGGLEGLIHISELSWGRVGHPSSVLERGQTVETYVLSVDCDAGRIALSLKRLRPDPWKTCNERYTTGEIVEGVITNVVDFGAFACIEEGLEGLIHVSELAEGHFLHPRNVVSEGQVVKARILSINGAARRLGLSLRLTP